MFDDFDPTFDVEFDLEEMDIEEMSAEQIREYLTGLEGVLADLDEREPMNMMSDAYDIWANEHEELEDLMDELRDRLDELEE